MKTIKELAALVPGAVIHGDKETLVLGMEHDSRKVERGTMFVCIPGAHVDGHAFIPQAEKNGATSILTTRDDVEPPYRGAVLVVPDLSKALEVMVPFFHDYPSRSMRVIGITGTNGKTTTSYIIRDILREAGYKVGLIGTIKIMIEEESFPIHNTTPDVVELQHIFATMRDRGMDYVVMEVSSHALDQNRVAGIEFDTVAFTNLTQDHLDYHKTLDSYKLAKAKLFEMVGRPGTKQRKYAVANMDDAVGGFMLEYAHCPHLTYAIDNEATLRAEDVEVGASGTHIILHADLRGRIARLPLRLPLIGSFNVYNVLAAASVAMAERVEQLVLQRALENFHSVPGRFELVRTGLDRQDFSVIVDYAHTPDGVENVLKTAREITENRIIAVFGCGGDRDRTKRPIMGRLAAELADVIIATSDNPRSEDPEAILDDVEAGVREALGSKQHERIADRREAVFRAVELAGKGDIVIVMGKGHEDYQILKDKTIHFDDKEVACEAVKAKYGA